MASMILQLGLQALKNKSVRLFRSGEQKRDFVYIEDVVQANVRALPAKQNGVYNVGSGMARSFNDIIGILKNEFGDFETEYIDNPYTFYQEHTEADISCTQRWLGYQPNYSLEKGIKCYAKAIRELYISNA
jgi:ADP-L-glycero-D-manno-heptose 6-epimerase